MEIQDQLDRLDLNDGLIVLLLTVGSCHLVVCQKTVPSSERGSLKLR